MSATKHRGPFTLQSTRLVYQNPWIRLREDVVLRPNGERGIFGVIEMQTGSTVLPINDENEVYLLKEYKYGIERESIELVSGGLDEDESPIDAAKRELKEETGLEAATWVDFGVVDPFTTIVSSPNHMFLALGARQTSRPANEEEILEQVTVPLQHAVDMVMEGQITHAASCVLLLKAYKYFAEKDHSCQ